jgi:dTDP-4-amino-4,6-dideoxygalactose transaminase
MIPIFELKRQYKAIQKEIDGALSRVLTAGTFILGPEVIAFEDEFARFVGTYHAVGVASGTDALTLAIRAHGLGEGDEVIIPANSYPSAFGISQSGVTMKLVDVGEDGNIDTKKLEKIVTKKTKAVVAVHLYGNPADVERIQNILNRKQQKAVLIEDCAQAHGAVIKDGSSWKHVGTFGKSSCFSFYPSKNLGAYGDGGMVVTDNSNIAKRVKQLRMYGETSRYHSEEVSGVSRLDELHAAILRVKLEHLNEWVKRRREIAELYTDGLHGISDIRFVSPHIDTKSAYHLFVIRASKRDALMEYLLSHGVGCAVHYPVSIHLTPSFANLGYKRGDFPVSESLSREVLSLPIYPELTDSEVATVIKTVKSFYRK